VAAQQDSEALQSAVKVAEEDSEALQSAEAKVAQEDSARHQIGAQHHSAKLQGGAAKVPPHDQQNGHLCEESSAIALAKTVKQPVLGATQLIKGPRTITLPFGATMQLGASAIAQRGGVVTLQSGDALVRGKKGAVIHSGTTTLKPQSEVVLLASSSDVAVLKGAVLVERDDGTSLLVHEGESVRFDRGAVIQRRLDAKRFAALNVTLAPAASSIDLQFIERAQLSLKSGRCGEFLLGLETLAFDSEEDAVRARARMTKARCHDERLEPAKAAADYSRYLRDFPNGEFAAEARAVLSAQ
jgi:hypothetical protein